MKNGYSSSNRWKSIDIFYLNSREKKILIFKILNSFLIVYFIKSPKSLLSLEYLKKNYFLNPLFEWKMIERGDPYLLFREYQEEKTINFQYTGCFKKMYTHFELP